MLGPDLAAETGEARAMNAGRPDADRGEGYVYRRGAVTWTRTSGSRWMFIRWDWF